MKVLKYIILNFVILILFIGIFEFILVKKYLSENPSETYHIGVIPYNHLYAGYKFRKPSGLNYSKPPIMIMGGSFAYGESLDENDTFSAKLSKYSKRPVYNYAIKGKSLQNSLYLVENALYDDFSSNPPEYAIYVMMDDHIRRFYSNVCMGDYVGQPIFILQKDGTLKQKLSHYPVYRQFYTFYYINNLIYNKFLKNDFDRHNKYVNAYFSQIRDELRYQFPDIKFVILLYGNDNNFGLDFTNLEKDGFIVINTNQLTGINLLKREYQLADNDTHPTAEAWDIISNSFVKEFKL